MSRVIPAHAEVPHHTPQIINPNVPPSPPQLAITIHTPNLLHLITELSPKDLPESISVITESCGEDSEVCIERAAVFELQPSLSELFVHGVILESDLSVDDHLAGPGVCKNQEGQEKFG